MVRRKVVGVGKQLSLPAYQQLMSQGSSFRAPARQPHQVASMADYWHNMCWSKMSGAVPRMAVAASPEPSSRRLTRLRRQLMWSPTEIVNVPQPKSMRMVQGNYVRQQQQQPAPAQLQLGYPPTWGRAQWEAAMRSHPPVATQCGPMKASSWGDYQIGAAMAQQHQNSASSLNIIECPGCQSEVPVCYFETESSRFAAAASRIEQQQKELHQKQLQLQKLQEFHLSPSPQPSQVNAPIGILKKEARPEGGQSVANELHAKKTKRVTIHAMNGMDGKLHARVLAPGKPKPLADRRIGQQKKEPQRDQPQGYQRKHQPAHEQHAPASVKLPLQQQSPCTFNFGKFVNNFIDSYDRSSVSEGTDSDSGSFIFEPPNAGDTAVKPKKSSKVRSKAGSKAGSLNGEPRRPPEWPKLDRILRKTEPGTSKRKGKGKRSSRRLGDHHGADSGTSTSTLTKEQSRETLRTPKRCVESARRSRLVPKTPHQSQTSIKPEQGECPARERHSSLDVHEGICGQAPNREHSDSVGKKERIRKVNINQLLQNPELQDGNVVWESLMQLVGQMCDPLEEEEDEQPESETSEEQRMMAGYGSDLRQTRKRKQYSVYLMVNSDDDNDDQEYSSPKLETESPDILAASHSHNQISCESHNQTLDESLSHSQQDDYANHCYRLFQEEQCKPSRRKRKRRSVSRIRELAYPYPMPPPNQVLRRPLHWPKPDMSKPQTRLQRPRSTSKPPAQKRRQRSISTVQQQLHGQRQWQKVPLATASCMMYPMMNSAVRHHF